jgi:parallel beta-helix repeat protein
MKTKSLLLLTIGLGLTLAAVWLLALSGFGVQEAHAASFTVCPVGPPTCDYSVIQYAVDAAGEGDVIKVAMGTYNDVNSRYGLAQIVAIEKSITIQGGYTTAFTEPPDPVANPTTLDAGGLGRVIYIEGNINPTIAGLRITGGEAKDLGSPIGIDAGGGVLVISATATLKDNYIYENSADSTHNGDGGGVFLLNSDATLESNTIISNTAEREGGGINLANSPATLTGNTISQNESGRGEGAGLFLGFSPASVDGNTISENYGVGLWGDQDAVNITNNTIVSNTGGGIFLWQCNDARVIANNISYNAGGGVQSWGDNILISGNTISHNTAEWGGGVSFEDKVTYIGNTISFNSATRGGGGLFGDGDVTLTANSFISNTAEMGGGLLIPDATDVEITGNTFSGNHASSQGGGLDLWGGNPILTNNIIVDNQSDGVGSAIHTSGSSLRLLHNTVARNTGGDGSGIYAITNSNIALTNTIIVSHTVGIYVHFDSSASLESTLWGNGIWANGTDWSGAGTINLSNNYWGDPAFVNYLAGNYHIGENSDAIDAGIDAGVTTDIDNHPRPYQLPDIGADEYWPPGALKFIYLPVVIK